jgi:NAD(P)-dependent dehydrogenase (short-subunit alcohol dehydrogenase family)
MILVSLIYNPSNSQDMQHYFKDKTVLVTGAGWGIGAATALLYAAYGAKVIVSDTSRKGGRDTMAKIKSQNGTATYIQTDVSDEAACEKLISRTIETYGSIDIACNNSTIFSAPTDPVLVLKSIRNCMEYEIEAMLKQGGGIIVNTSSIIGKIGLTSPGSFVKAKYGMTAVLQNSSGVYACRGIHINTIPTTYINTALLSTPSQAENQWHVKLSPMERPPRMVQEVARLVLWLSSDEKRQLPTAFHENN